MEGVLKEVPDPRSVPPVEAEYQSMVPAEAAAPNVRTPGPQLESDVEETTLGIEFTVAKTATLDEAEQPFTLCASA